MALDWLWLLLLGLGTGTYGVLVGAGGGFILAPALLIFFDIEPGVVAGTSLALVAINSVSGTFAYRRLGLIDYRSALLFAAAAIPGSVIGPFVVKQVHGDTFRIAFGILLIALTVQMALRSIRLAVRPKKFATAAGFSVRGRRIVTKSGQVFEYRFNEALATSINVALGFMSSFFGTGGGFIRTPLLITAFGFPVRVAVATSVFTLSIYTLAGTATHASLGHIDWYPTLIWAGLGVIVGGQVGAMLGGRLQSRSILWLLMVVLFALGTSLLVQGLAGG
ncbi:MAG: sulfite exporter TauE/SafE family protein [Chloroflexi bacterium]|nr:sulfite exporter TauE/SafE family protein [Chloroflexota bacterium]